MPDKLSILIIEEREADYIRLKKCIDELEDYKTTVVWKNNYEDGLEFFTLQDIDICFLDSHLGEGTGKDFLNELKQLKELIPIILIGNKRNADLKGISEEDGVDDFFLRQLLSPHLVRRSIRYGLENHKKALLLKGQEEKYSKLFYNSIEAIFTADKNYRIIEANRSFKNLIQMQNLEEFDFRNLFIGNDYENLFQKLSSTRKKNMLRTQIQNTNGEKLEVYVSIAPIYSVEEEVCFQGIIHDITELEEAQSKIVEADNLKLISRMARIIGHEVRNPLTNIVLATEELRQDLSENEDAIMMLDMVQRNSDRISGLIDNFLESTRNASLIKESVMFNSVISEAINNCRDRILLRKINLVTEGCDNELMVHLDRTKIVIVFTNILINAVEALDGIENPELKVTVMNSSDFIKIEIKDNGSGMSDDIKKNLFKPFYSSKQGGLGLGMTNAKNIVENHQGKISIESTLNKGTTFYIEFPLSIETQSLNSTGILR